MIIYGKDFAVPCACGKKHEISTEEIVIEKGALSRLPGFIAERNFRNITMICDGNTYSVAGEKVTSLLPECGIILLSPDGLRADEVAVQYVLDRLPQATDLLLAVGSGTINDITRYVSAQKGIPFISVPTAASIDGYVSTVAAMTWHGFKKSFIACAPLLVAADTDIFANAPYCLTASGVSDLLGKYTAITDWKIAHIVTGEYICEKACALELGAVENLRGDAAKLKAGDTGAFERLMYGLSMSGLAMQMVGNSRPASGAEHHLSHLWEMEILNSHVDAYHGEKVGVGLLLTAQRYHETKNHLLSNDFTIQRYEGREAGLLERNISDQAKLDAFLQENTPDPLDGVNIEILRSKCGQIADILNELPAPDEIREIMVAAGAKTSLRDIGLNENIAWLSMRISPFIRKSITFMRLLKLFDFYYRD